MRFFIQTFFFQNILTTLLFWGFFQNIFSLSHRNKKDILDKDKYFLKLIDCTDLDKSLMFQRNRGCRNQTNRAPTLQTNLITTQVNQFHRIDCYRWRKKWWIWKMEDRTTCQVSIIYFFPSQMKAIAIIWYK